MGARTGLTCLLALFAGGGLLTAAGLPPDQIARIFADAWDGKPAALREAVRLREVGPKDVDKEGNTAFVWFAYHGEFATAEALLAQGADPNQADQRGLTALHRCADAGQVDAVKFLLKHHALVDATNRWRETPLNLACVKGHDEIAELLLVAHADPNLAAQHGAPLIYAAGWGNTRIVRLLLQAGAHPDVTDPKEGNTPLISAAAHGHLETLRLLLALRGPLDATNKHGRTALLAAAEAGHTTVVSELAARGANVLARDLAGRSAIFYAANSGDAGCVEELRRRGASTNDIALRGFRLDAVSDPLHRWHFALSAIELMRWHQDAAQLASPLPTGPARRNLREALRTGLKISNRQQALTALKEWQRLPQVKELAEIAANLTAESEAVFNQRQTALLLEDPALMLQRKMVRDHTAAGGIPSLVAWQAASIIHLAHLCVAAGYLTEADTTDFVEPAAGAVSATYGSWDDYARNLLFGQVFRFRRQQPQWEMFARMLKNKSDTNSPWNQIPWPAGK